MPRAESAPSTPPPPAAGTAPDIHHEVVVVGAGMAGIGAAIQLKAAGIDFVVLEKAAAIGGVWRDNHYPDCGCDVPSALYSFSFAPHPGWSRMFAKQPEILAYTEDTARRFGVLDRIRLQTELTQATWQQERSRWQVQTSRGSYTARFLVMACGPMHVPVVPRIRGLEGFEGPHFHSARWDHRCDLRDKRVAVIGSGASAIQFVPEIQRTVKTLTLFQRTAPWVLPKMDVPISPAWQGIFRRLPFVQSLLRQLLYLQFELLNSGLRYPWLVKRLQRVGMRAIRRGIRDPELQARVTPDFALGCKRILLSNRWYRALDKPNVSVLGGIAEIQGNTVVAADGTRREVDAIIFATGFEVADPPIAQRIVGASGRALSELWQGSPQAYLGTMAQDCPNLFLTFGPNLYTFTSAFVIVEAQLRFILSAIRTAQAMDLASIAVDPQRCSRYNAQVQEALGRTVWNSGCASYFIDRNGRNSTNWPWSTSAMRRRLARFAPEDFRIERTP